MLLPVNNSNSFLSLVIFRLNICWLYIYIHGQMKTIYELQLVEEMDRQTIQYLLPFVCIKAINNEPAFRWKSLLKSAAKYGKNEAVNSL